MSDVIQIVVSALTLLGIGGILGGYVTYVLDKKKEREFKVLEQKERRIQIMPLESLSKIRCAKIS